MYSLAVIIISDRASSGIREDECLPVIKGLFEDSDFEIKESTVISDEPEEIRKTIGDFIAKQYNLILTSGGTGCAQRDNTPEITREFLDKPTPGLDEAIRDFSRSKAPYAMFSRAVSGVAKKSFVINLPGSPKAVREITEFIIPVIEHPLKLIAGTIDDCQKELQGHD
jgi:molybdenum cofactor synthesis domain-containing protein